MTDKSQEHIPPTLLVFLLKPGAGCMFFETASVRSAGQARTPAKATGWRQEGAEGTLGHQSVQSVNVQTLSLQSHKGLCQVRS